MVGHAMDRGFCLSQGPENAPNYFFSENQPDRVLMVRCWCGSNISDSISNSLHYLHQKFHFVSWRRQNRLPMHSPENEGKVKKTSKMHETLLIVGKPSSTMHVMVVVLLLRWKWNKNLRKLTVKGGGEKTWGCADGGWTWMLGGGATFSLSW